MVGRDIGTAAEDQGHAEDEGGEESCGGHGYASCGSREDDYRYDTARWKGWSRAALLLAWLVVLAGCFEGVKFIQETDTGGVVAYPYKGDNALISTFRHEALDLIRQKCPKGFDVLKEGQTKSLRRIQDKTGGAETIELKRWAIKFQCK